MTFGERLTYFREKRGWTKTYVANKLGIKTMSTYANWEYDLRQPDIEMLEKSADLYDVCLDVLVGRESRMNDESLYNNDIDPELQNFIDEVKVWYKDEPKDKQERLEMMKKMFEVFKED